MRKVVLILVLVLAVNTFSQNKQVLYDFAGLPQTLLLNPGLENNLKFHVGLPLISGFSAEIGSTGFSVADIFADDGRNINEKMASVLDNIDSKDYLKLNTQIEVFSAGYRFNDKTYLSFGFYEELDFIFFLPKDVLTLATEGNTTPLGRSFDFSHLNINADFLGVIHAGITRKVSEKLTIGGRLKIYSSSINVESINNSGTFTTTTPGDNNLSVSKLENINVTYKTAGIANVSGGSVLTNTFLGGNLGLGGDVGFSYSVTPQLNVSGSLVDFGFIKYSKNIENTTRIGDFTTEGLNFQYDDQDPDYWKQLEDDFKAEIPEEINNDAYKAWRPAKLNAAIKYSFGDRRSESCYDNTFKESYTDAFGVQLYSLFRPLRNEYAFTGFYEKSITSKIDAKLTYTLDNYSYNNIGLGISAQIWNMNFYGIVDNIAHLSDISSAKNVSLQFGFNLLFN
ncbi:hypothetical protein BTO04_13620 [Polaribacter sp. SA4-10]|uniref:DUF5723 family protein n=1 Tax=Polaribacter sp. SA4-10 TaxID=754397 RepID=UPI000B3D4E0C|nr:DUF5723 family protein [Polaribacter sp. SA4-10]ARV07666.1 hypothetical protein BTO04_13620 [Polaribacter sp. SA4-10]